MSLPDAMRFLFLNQPTQRAYIPRQPEGTTIPRIIHQTHRAWDAVPADIRDSIATLRSRNPGWDYRFYDDGAVTRFIRDSYGPVVLGYFQRVDPRYGAARADLFRYLLTYRVGGVYLDIKSSIRPPLDAIIHPDERLILAQWSQTDRFVDSGRHDWDLGGRIEGGELQQWHVICAPGHPYLYAVIQAVMRNIDSYIPGMHGSGRSAVLRVTGPIAYTLAMVPLLASKQHRLVASHEAMGLEYSVFPDNADHKRLFGGAHYTELTVPVVRANLFRRALSVLYRMFDSLRRHRPASSGTPR
jgi:hypothetical protein